MGCFYRGQLAFSCIFVWSMAIFRLTDSSSITWHEPPPFESVTDTAITSATNTTLTKGSFNEELSCNFSLTADLSFKVVTFELGRVAVASYVNGEHPTVADHFVSRFNVTWVPSKLTLIVFNVTNDDKGEYRCRVQTFSGGLKTWLRIIKVDLLVQAQITNVTGKTVIEGGNVTLKCLAKGNPTPTIMWTRLSDHSVVTMPLTNIRRQNASVGYRCTADNGVKSRATRDVFLDVHYNPDTVSLVANTTENTNCSDSLRVNLTCEASDSSHLLKTSNY